MLNQDSSGKNNTTNANRNTKVKRTVIIAAVVALVLCGALFYWFFLRSTPSNLNDVLERGSDGFPITNPVGTTPIDAMGTVTVLDPYGKTISTGSAILVTEEGHIVTSAQLLTGTFRDYNAPLPERAFVTLDINGVRETYEIEEILALSITLDIALVKIDAQDLPALFNGEHNQVYLGQDVQILTTPGDDGALAKLTPATVEIIDNVYGIDVFRLDVPSGIAGANSVGAVIDAETKVIIGIYMDNNMGRNSLDSKDNLSTAISCKYIWGLSEYTITEPLNVSITEFNEMMNYEVLSNYENTGDTVFQQPFKIDRFEEFTSSVFLRLLNESDSFQLNEKNKLVDGKPQLDGYYIRNDQGGILLGHSESVYSMYRREDWCAFAPMVRPVDAGGVEKDYCLPEEDTIFSMYRYKTDDDAVSSDYIFIGENDYDTDSDWNAFGQFVRVYDPTSGVIRVYMENVNEEGLQDGRNIRFMEDEDTLYFLDYDKGSLLSAGTLDVVSGAWRDLPIRDNAYQTSDADASVTEMPQRYSYSGNPDDGIEIKDTAISFAFERNADGETRIEYSQYHVDIFNDEDRRIVEAYAKSEFGDEIVAKARVDQGFIMFSGRDEQMNGWVNTKVNEWLWYGLDYNGSLESGAVFNGEYLNVYAYVGQTELGHPHGSGARYSLSAGVYHQGYFETGGRSSGWGIRYYKGRNNLYLGDWDGNYLMEVAY